MPAGLIGSAIGAGTSLLGGILGSGAAATAAGAQQRAAQQASQLAGQAGQQSQNYLTQRIAQEGQNVSPYLSAGSAATNNLANLLAPGGQLTQQFGQFQAPTDVTMQNDPGYQFRIQQGINALQNSAAARGGLLSTGTAKNLLDYSQGAASQEYQNVYNRALQGYQTNFNTFNTQQNELYNRLFGVSQLGAGTATNLNAVQQQGTNALANSLMGTAQLQGQDLMGGANAAAAGTVGGTNALVGGLTGAANTIGGELQLNQILGAQNASRQPTNTLAQQIGGTQGNPYFDAGAV